MKPRVKLFLSTDAVDGVFGDGKWRLLRAVREAGSISKAASSLGRSYRKAWGDIKRAEEGLGRELVTVRRGGASGGAAVLTKLGERLVTAWEAYRQRVDVEVNAAYSEIVKPVLADARRRTSARSAVAGGDR